MTEMVCLNCSVVYDVVYEGEHIWHVKNPDFELIIDEDSEARPPDFKHSHQVQASVFPLCVKVECVISKTSGILTDKPIAVRFS